MPSSPFADPEDELDGYTRGSYVPEDARRHPNIPTAAEHERAEKQKGPAALSRILLTLAGLGAAGTSAVANSRGWEAARYHVRDQVRKHNDYLEGQPLNRAL